MQLKQEAGSWVNPDIRKCWKVLVLFGWQSESQELEPGARAMMQKLEQWWVGLAWVGTQTQGLFGRSWSHGEDESLVKIFSKVDQGISTLASPFLSLWIFYQCPPSAEPNQWVRKPGNHSLENSASSRTEQKRGCAGKGSERKLGNDKHRWGQCWLVSHKEITT